MAKPKKHCLNLENKQINRLLRFLGISDIMDIDTVLLKRLKENLKQLTDPRQQHKTHYKIWDIAMYVIIASFSNISDWNDISEFIAYKYNWFRSFLLMTGGIPSGKTIENIFSIISPKELENILTSFYLSMVHCTTNKDIINIDGRIDCGSSRSSTNYKDSIKPLNVLNAYSNNFGICLASEMIDDKTNEIPTIPVILERLSIKNVIITWDALNTQKDNVKCVIDKKGDYVVPIKENHRTFYHDLELYFNDKILEQISAGNSNSAYLQHLEKSHSCTFIYEYYQTSDIDWYFEKKLWKGLTTIGLVKKQLLKMDKLQLKNDTIFQVLM